MSQLNFFRNEFFKTYVHVVLFVLRNSYWPYTDANYANRTCTFCNRVQLVQLIYFILIFLKLKDTFCLQGSRAIRLPDRGQNEHMS